MSELKKSMYCTHIAVLDQLSLAGQVYRTVDHPPDPHHDVGVARRRQHRVQRQRELRPGLGQPQLLARLRDGAQEHVVPKRSQYSNNTQIFLDIVYIFSHLVSLCIGLISMASTLSSRLLVNW